MRIGLLHTAESHIAMFEDIAVSLDPEVELVHEVNPALLSRCQDEGVTQSLIATINVALMRLVDAGAERIACTCSTLGEIVEHRVVNGISVQRIDRAVADTAMNYSSILVLAAIESAAEAADRLLEGSAVGIDPPCRWLVVLVPGAWELFMAGDLPAYEARVADYANELAAGYDAVFLAQASMAGAARLCNHSIVLTSPVAGVRRLLATA